MVWAYLLAGGVGVALYYMITHIYQMILLNKVHNFRDEKGKRMRGSDPTFIVGDFIREAFFPKPLDDKEFLTEGDVYYRWFFWQPVVHLVEHAAIRRVLVDNMSNYVKSINMTKDNLVVANDFEFKRHRRIVSRAFNEDNLYELSDNLVKQSKLLLSDLILDAQGEGKVFSAHRTFLVYTRELMGRVMFGTSAEAQKVIAAQKIFTENSKSFLRYILPQLGRIAPGLFGMREAQEGIECLHSLIDHPEDATLLGLLVQSSAQDEDGLSAKELKSNILALGHAGIDATASALTSVAYMLVKFPDVQDRVRNEIHRVIGKGPITYDSLKSLPYLTTVIKETLRLCPPYPILFPRVAKRSDKLGGFHVPAKTRVVVNVVGHNRHPQYWTDPDAFVPERWDKVENDVETQKEIRKFNLSWGTGQRGSVGKRLAMVILRSSLVSILKSYKITSLNEEKANVDIVRSFGALKPQPELLLRASSIDM